MSDIEKVILEKEKKKIEKKLKEIIYKSELPALGRATRCYIGENKSLALFLQTKEDKFLKRAEAWNKTKKKYIKIGEEQSKFKWWVEDRIRLESDLSKLSSRLYYLNR